jgi:uncharacterized protein YjiS (DUF1127 family)
MITMDTHPDDVGFAFMPKGSDGCNLALGISANHGVLGWFLCAIDLVSKWRERVQGRRQLAAMPDHLLKDIGVTSIEAEREYNKPFWIG